MDSVHVGGAPPSFWFVGASWGGTEDQTPRFHEEGIWENGYDDRYIDEVRSMRPGERIAIKSTYTRKRDLPFDNRGESVSVMAIKATGTITGNPGDGKRVRVDWNTPENALREWYFQPLFETVHRVIVGEDWKRDGLIEFAFEGKPQDIERFLDDPRRRERYGASAGGRTGRTGNDERALKKLLDEFDMDRGEFGAAVLEAIEALGTNGWDPSRNSRFYDLVHNDQRFPPKEVLRRAFEACTGEARAKAPTPGGDPTNGPLRALGHRIESKSAPNEPDPEPYSIRNVIEEGCFLERQEIERLLERLRTRKNLILQGPPGTGKTWLAKRLAFALIGERDERKVRAVQFHPNLSYEDFVRGWRPVGDGKLALADGVFMETLRAASADSSAKFVVVIEEINRGNPAQIFGELLTLLEADKRSPRDAVELCYPDPDGTRRPVHVPENVYVIGTMNIADRSLALVDLALRRRFAFVTLEPSLGAAWSNWVVRECGIDPELVNELRRRITELNDRIAGDSRLGSQFRIGHSYVTPTHHLEPDATKDWFRQVVETEIGPLLEEYWFDSPTDARKAVQQLLEGW